MKSVVYKRFVILLFVLGIIILLLPSFLRIYKNNPVLIGSDSYFTVKVANLIINQGIIPDQDPLSFSGRIFPYSIGFPYIVASLSSLSKLELVYSCKITSLILGVLTIIIMYLSTNLLKYENKLKLLILAIIILSPPFIYAFSTCSNYGIILFLSSLAFYFLLLNKKVFSILSTIIIASLGLFSFYMPLIFLSIILLYVIIRDRSKLRWFIVTLLLTLGVIAYYNYYLLKLPLFYERASFEIRERSTNFVILSLISDFGGKFGIGVFSLILSFFGLKKLWVNKYKNLHIYLIIILLIVLSLYLNESLFYLNILISITAAIGLITIMNNRWQSNLIKILIVLIIICGVIFSGFSYINRLSDELPNKNYVRGLIFLKERTNANEVIFTYYTRGHWINAVSERKNFMDDYFAYAPGINERWSDSQTILHSREEDNTTKLLEKYNINYIWLDNDLKSSLWESESGLLLVLKHSKNFKKIYFDNDVEIWKYEKTVS